MSDSIEPIVRRDSSVPSAQENPLRSKKWTAYVLTLVAVVVCAALKVDGVALEYLSLAVMLGLPTLLGGQSAIDVAKARVQR